MYGMIVSPAYDFIQDILEPLIFEKTGYFDLDEFTQHCQAAARVNIETLFIDIDCATEDAIIKGVRQYRMLRNTRIVLLCPGRQPGDPTVAALVGLQVWDIIAPATETVETVDEETDDDSEIEVHEENSNNLTDELIKQQIQRVLSTEMSYGNAARWHFDGSSDQEKSKSPKKKREKKEKREKNDPPYKVHLSEISYEELELGLARPQKIIVEEKVVGNCSIGVATIQPKSGGTHAAIQMANYLAKKKLKVACVERIDPSYNRPSFQYLETDMPSKHVPGGFHLHGVDYFYDLSDGDYYDVLSSSYTHVVIDLGQVMFSDREEKVENTIELMRSDYPILVASSSLWCIDDVLKTIDTFKKWRWKRSWRLLLNFAGDQLFEMLQNLDYENILFYQNFYTPDPFDITDSIHEYFDEVLEPIVPLRREKKKKFSFWRSF